MPRFSYALLGALALHGLALLVRAQSPMAASPSAHVRPASQSVELEEFPVEEAPTESGLAEATSATRDDVRIPSAPANRSAHRFTKDTSAPPDASSEPALGTDAPVAVGSAEAGEAEPSHKIDLGLDGHFFIHDPALARAVEPAPARELGPRARKSTVQQQLQTALLTDDVKRGLARGNALIGSLSSAARADGPLRGEGTFRVTVAADGSLGNVELVRGTEPQWAAVLSSFRELAARKHVRVPPGTKGLRVTFRVQAKVQRASGKAVEATAVGVDDPSLAPNGLLLNGDFDVADLGGGSQRLVYARVVSEEVL